MHSLSRLLRFLPALAALVISACGGDADGSSQARVRVLNLSEGYESIALYSNNGDSIADTEVLSGVARGTVSSYASVSADTYVLKFRRTGATGTLLSQSITLAEDMKLTFVATGATGGFSVLSIDEDSGDPDDGYGYLQVLNTTAGTFDFYFTEASESLDDVSPVLYGVSKGSTGTTAALEAGTYRLRVTATGSKTDIRLNIPEVTIAEGGLATLIVTDTEGGVLVNAVLLPRDGQPVSFSNTDSARLRILNVSVGYPQLDLYTNDRSGPADVLRFSGVDRGSTSDYASVTAATYDLKFRRSGATGTLLTEVASLSEDTNITYVAYGTTNRFAIQALQEDQSAPNAGYTRLRMLNTTSSNLVDVYLTGSADSLDDVAPLVPEVGPGTLSTDVVLPSGAYRLRITRAASKSDVRLDVPAVELASAGVGTLVLTDSPGGMLMGAVLLPQQGEPVAYDNANVRVRGAAGLSSGSSVSIVLGASEIVSRRPARSFISGSYSLLDAGEVTATVYVDDVAVLSGMLTLQRGMDYTLLAWDAGGSPRITLLSDDNHVGAGGRARLRLMNAMSGLGAPINLSVNYLPIAEYTDVGTASDYADITLATDYRFDVIDAQSLEPLLSRDSVTMTGGGIYTLLLSGGGASPVAGTLRQDR